MKCFAKITVALAMLVLSVVHARGQCSLLGNINCGGGQATCYQLKTAVSGGVRCTCTATCLSPASSYPSVAATRSFQWGFPNNCNFNITGTATGGTAAVAGKSVFSSVFAEVTAAGPSIALNTYSRQQVDCFQGDFWDDPPILGLC
jgi:hypothetical protein